MSKGTNTFLKSGLKRAWEFENGFYQFSHPSRLAKALAHYELYKSVVHLPGDVFELGVYKAASLCRLATYRNLLENDSSRKIVAFDAFGEFPRHGLQLKSDIEFIKRFENEGGKGLSVEQVQSILEAKGFTNTALLKGNVVNTIPKYLES